ncbi:MAG: hypothetical protein AB1597_01650 [Chloroflexota bacterium]
MTTSKGMPTNTAKVFKVVAKAAEAQKLITYKEVGVETGLHWRQVPGRLYAIWQWCEAQHPSLPHLNAIVVNSITRRPGSGYTPNGEPLREADFQTMKNRVFGFDWKSVQFPGT